MRVYVKLLFIYITSVGGLPWQLHFTSTFRKHSFSAVFFDFAQECVNLYVYCHILRNAAQTHTRTIFYQVEGYGISRIYWLIMSIEVPQHEVDGKHEGDVLLYNTVTE